MLGLTQVEKKEKLFKKLNKLRAEIDDTQREIDKTEKELESFKLKKYMVAKKTTFMLDVIKLVGICYYEGKPGFVYNEIWLCDDELHNDTNHTWFQKSVIRDYKEVTKKEAEVVVTRALTLMDNMFNKKKKEFFGEDD